MLRRFDKASRVGPGPITARSVFETVSDYTRRAGLSKITPYHLRRTFSKLAHQGRGGWCELLGPMSSPLLVRGE